MLVAVGALCFFAGMVAGLALAPKKVPVIQTGETFILKHPRTALRVSQVQIDLTQGTTVVAQDLSRFMERG